jgi:septal ring factor EnvC (AmiA/AmiB activator)
MRLWRRWFHKSDMQEDLAYGERRPPDSTKQEASQLRAELRHLQQQRQALEQRGCFSDRELAAKDRELDQLDLDIKTLKTQQFRLRIQGRSLV